jgi:hypothetical protein
MLIIKRGGQDSGAPSLGYFSVARQRSNAPGREVVASKARQRLTRTQPGGRPAAQHAVSRKGLKHLRINRSDYDPDSDPDLELRPQSLSTSLSRALSSVKERGQGEGWIYIDAQDGQDRNKLLIHRLHRLDNLLTTKDAACRGEAPKERRLERTRKLRLVRVNLHRCTGWTGLAPSALRSNPLSKSLSRALSSVKARTPPDHDRDYDGDNRYHPATDVVVVVVVAVA